MFLFGFVIGVLGGIVLTLLILTFAFTGDPNG
jgi:hypothetical protein